MLYQYTSHSRRLRARAKIVKLSAAGPRAGLSALGQPPLIRKFEFSARDLSGGACGAATYAANSSQGGILVFGSQVVTLTSDPES
jgi:hypothetical protein